MPTRSRLHGRVECWSAHRGLLTREAVAIKANLDEPAIDAEARAQALILGLGFKTTELNNPVNSFSGGWRMRLQLAQVVGGEAVHAGIVGPRYSWAHHVLA